LSNTLKSMEKDLRAFAKRSKDVKYTKGLLLSFLLMGAISFAETLTSPQVKSTENAINQTKRDLNTSISDMHKTFKQTKRQNNKLLRNANLELIQLMEQGDQVVKIPWNTWQWGTVYTYNDWRDEYKGKGDKKEKYPFNGMLVRDANELNRYMLKSDENYASLPQGVNPYSASSNLRTGIITNYGLTNTGPVNEEPRELALSAGIRIKEVNKNSPASTPSAPTIVLPAFEPRLVTPPVAPEVPILPAITIPTFNVNVASNGNGGGHVIDGNGSNSFIQEVAVTGGEFEITRTFGNSYGADNFTYNYTGYSGVNAWGSSPAISNHPTHTAPVPGGGTWSGWNRTGGVRNGVRGAQNVTGDGSGRAAFLNNGNFLYTNLLYQNPGTTYLGEFAHLDIHASLSNSDARNGYVTAINNGGSPLTNGSSILGAFDDMVNNVNATTLQGSGTNSGSPTHSWINSGRLVIEGGWSSISNTYTHTGGDIKQMAANTGEVIFQPYKDSTGTVADIYTAGFVVSNDVSGPAHSIMYNGSTGKIKTYTRSHANFVADPGITKPISSVNRGEIQMYGENSAGVYIKKPSANNILFNSEDFTFNVANNTVTNGSFKPIEMYGDKSIGLYAAATSGSIEGNFAVDIGAHNKKNQKFTTSDASNKSAGTFLTDYDINPTDPNNENIQGSFGIISKIPTNLTTHQIRIYDKTEGSVGVMPDENVLLKIGGGSIELNGGTTVSGVTTASAKNNIGIYINQKGAVESTGDIKVDNGFSNLATYVKGGNSLPGGATEHVKVREIKGTDTKNSILVYGEAGAKIKATGGLTMTGAIVEADANTTNKKDSGAVFGKGANTEITIDRTAVPTNANIEITGTRLTDPNTNRYVGFGLMAQDGAKINAKNNNIKITNGSAGAASTGSNAKIDLTGSKVEYSGEGYALYAADSGKIDMTNGTLTLRGKAVGFEKDLSLAPGNQPVTTTGMGINVYSNDVTIVRLKNAPGTLALNGLQSNLTTMAGIGTINNVESGVTYNKYKLAVIDGLADYRIDKPIDKSIAAVAGTDPDLDMFTKNLIVQRAKVNTHGSNVTAHLNSGELTALGVPTVVGLDMNSSTSANTNNETQLNVQAGSTVSADRVDNGAGAVGLFINYGEANINSGGTVNVEKSGINGENSGAVGIYGVNGSKSTNEGTINVGGSNSIGILGISWRKDGDGNLVKNEFKTDTHTPAGLGEVEVINKSAINLNGESAVGIYVENNDDDPAAAHNVRAENASTGTITMTGTKAVGMAAKKGNITNSGTLNMTGADQGVGMFGDVSGTLTNNGTISTGDAASENAIRIGMFTTNAGVGIVNNGVINAGKNSYGIYGKNVTANNGSVFNVGENGVGIFSKATQSVPTATDNITINAGTTFNIGDNNAVGVFTENDTDGIQVTDNGSTMNIGNNSYGYVFKGHNTKFTNTASSNVTIGTNAAYLYSNDVNGNITNNINLTSTNDQTYGVYSAGTVTNNGNLNFETGVGNVGVYSIRGGTATNNGNITVGETYIDSSNANNNKYALGMAAGYQTVDSGNIINSGTIDVKGTGSIGMYATGSNSHVTNNGTINLIGNGTMGIYLDEGARGDNYGTITTVGSPTEAIGVVLRKNSILTNHPGANIHIDSAGGAAEFRARGGMIVNYGNITVAGGATEIATPQGNRPLDKTVDGIRVDPRTGTVTRNGINVEVESVTNPVGERREILYSPIAMYVDTLRRTNPIDGINNLGVTEMSLAIGTEAADITNNKNIKVSGELLRPYNESLMDSSVTNLKIYSASMTWIAAGTLDNLLMAKIPYTSFSSDKNTTKDTYNFTDGLEQRYSMNAIGSREKQLFNKLNRIGKNEEVLLYQAFDEMMGHQYANVQHRVSSTSQVLDKEINKLSSQWQNTTKKSSKITTFGARGEYNTDTAGIIDYTNNAFGVAYIHENETIKLGNSSGWYAGAVNNTFKFKDIGKSKENVTMVKAGVYNTKAFDNNGSLQWTISGEGFASRSAMERKYLVVDEIFKAKSDYNTYGVAVKNEISKEFRTGERFSIRPYGSLKLEYGKFGDIKEKSGEMRLEVKGNDYISVKPEVGMEFKYKRAVGRYGTFSTTLGLGYENELGKVDNVKNKARVANTNAEWFGMRSEKDDRKGNFKADLTVGIDNSKFGVTVNGGYDTKGKNVRGGIGFKFMY